MNYWIVIDRQKFGPLTLEETRRMPLRRDSYVWHRGLPDWLHAEEIPELADLFAATTETVSDQAEPETEITETLVNEPSPLTLEQPTAPPPPFPAPPTPPSPPSQEQQSARPPKPPTYLGWSIAAIICCCLITGIVAVIYASKVTPLYEQGRFDDAAKASERAELWLIISITVGLVAFPFQVLMSMA